jgi:hypothetical protein
MFLDGEKDYAAAAMFKNYQLKLSSRGATEIISLYF